jgi:hypothetical protein
MKEKDRSALHARRVAVKSVADGVTTPAVSRAPTYPLRKLENKLSITDV